MVGWVGEGGGLFTLRRESEVNLFDWSTVASGTCQFRWIRASRRRLLSRVRFGHANVAVFLRDERFQWTVFVCGMRYSLGLIIFWSGGGWALGVVK